MGVGSSGVAAQNLNRKFTGIELDSDYYYAARKRLNSTTLEDRIYDISGQEVDDEAWLSDAIEYSY
jgi:DNA modification methylase